MDRDAEWEREEKNTENLIELTLIMLLKIQYWSLPIGLPTRSPFSHHAHTHAAVRCMCAARPKHINIMKCDVDLCICMGHQQHNDDYQATVNSPLFSSLAKQEYHKWAKQKIKKKYHEVVLIDNKDADRPQLALFRVIRPMCCSGCRFVLPI